MATSDVEATAGSQLDSQRVAGGVLPKELYTFDMVATFVAIVLARSCSLASPGS